MKLQKSAVEPEVKISAQQKKFQRLSKKVEQEKQRLEQWQVAQKEVQTRAFNQLLPAYAQLREVIFAQIERLVQQKKQKLTKGQLSKLDDKIQTLSFDLLDSQQMSATQVAYLLELLKEYGLEFEAQAAAFDQAGFEDGFEGAFDQADFEGSFEDVAEGLDADDAEQSSQAQQIHAEIDALKDILIDEYDLSPDFFDFSFDPHNPEDFMQKFAEKIEQQFEQEFLDQCSAQERKQIEKEIAAERAKAAKKEQQRQQAKKVANQSIKTVYLKIAAMIHPDREQDEQKKQHKTELLQQVNQAYAANDLLNLLAVQIELGLQQDAPFAQQQLKAYNIVLEEQIEKIDMEIEDIIDSFHWDGYIGAYSNRKIKIQDLYNKYEQDWSLVQQKIEQAKKTLDWYKDLQTLKTLMRSQHIWEMC